MSTDDAVDDVHHAIDDDFKEQVLKWRTEHEARFCSPTGWLALTGHYWLKPGENCVGSTKECAVHLPADAGTNLVGVVKVTDNRVTLTARCSPMVKQHYKPNCQSMQPCLKATARSSWKLAIG